MAFTRTSTGRSYIGLSSDAKPKRGRQFDATTITAAELPVGSTFTELDTGNTAMFDGNEWIYIPKPPRHDMDARFTELIGTVQELVEIQKQMLLLMSSGGS